MDRKEQLVICKKCIHHKRDFKKGIICSLTNDYPSFKNVCNEYLSISAFSGKNNINKNIKIPQTVKKSEQAVLSKKTDCEICNRHIKDENNTLLCGLTGKVPSFENECEDFVKNEEFEKEKTELLKKKAEELKIKEIESVLKKVKLNFTNVNKLSIDEINEELKKGGKFVIYQYCISIVLMTFKQPTDVHFIRSDQNATLKGLIYTFISLILGWWGIPWGPIYTLGTIITNLSGGKDITKEAVTYLGYKEILKSYYAKK